MGPRHRPRAERLTAAAAFTALGLGGAGMAFERAGPSVMTASAEELTSWASGHRRELTAQSVVYLVSTAPLLAYVAGLGRVTRSPAVLAGGTTWVGYQVAAQVAQMAMARAASQGEPDVADHARRMTDLLRHGNAALGVAAAATADASLRRGLLPRWLGVLSAATAVAHAAPLVAHRSGRESAAVEVLPYPFFVAWIGAVAVGVLRRAG